MSFITFKKILGNVMFIGTLFLTGVGIVFAQTQPITSDVQVVWQPAQNTGSGIPSSLQTGFHLVSGLATNDGDTGNDNILYQLNRGDGSQYIGEVYENYIALSPVISYTQNALAENFVVEFQLEQQDGTPVVLGPLVPIDTVQDYNNDGLIQIWSSVQPLDYIGVTERGETDYDTSSIYVNVLPEDVLFVWRAYIEGDNTPRTLLDEFPVGVYTFRSNQEVLASTTRIIPADQVQQVETENTVLEEEEITETNPQTSQFQLVTGQPSYTSVAWNTVEQVQDSLGQYVYNFDVTTYFVNQDIPQDMELRFSGTPSFSGNTGDTLVGFADQDPTSSPHHFSTTFDPAFTNTILSSGQYYYIGLFADGTLLSWRRLSAYEQPDSYIATQWIDPSVQRDTQTNNPFIRLRAEIVPSSDLSTSTAVTLGPAWSQQVIIEDFPTLSSFGITTDKLFFEQFSDASGTTSFDIIPDQNYYSIIYNDGQPVAGEFLGNFISDARTSTNTNNSAGTGTNIGNVQIGDTTINALTTGISGNYSFTENGLVPCGGAGEEECSFNHIIVLIENILNFVFVLVIPIAAIAFTYAGFLYMTGGASPDKRKKANKIFLNVLIGIIIIMTAWIIVVTILRTLGVDGTTYSLLDF